MSSRRPLPVRRPGPGPAWPALMLLPPLLLAGCAGLGTGPAHPGLRPADRAQAVEVAASGLPATWAGLATAPASSSPSSDSAPTVTIQAAAATTSATTLAGWWRSFQDPLLSRLIEQALAANTSLQSARAALQQARALRDVARAGLSPSLGLSASAQHSQAGSGRTAQASNSVKLGLDAGWEIDLFGQHDAALEAATAGVAASAASLGQVQTAIAGELALDYVALRGSQARLAIAQANLAAQQETLQLTRWRAQAGLASALEVAQAETAAVQTEAQQPALRAAIAQARHAIALLTGQPPAALDAVLDEMLDQRSAAATPLPQPDLHIAVALPAQTLRQRADVAAAEAQVLQAWAQVRQADAARQPGLNLSGSLGLSALRLGSLMQPSALLATVLAGVSVPLVDGGAGAAQVRAQQAALAQAQAAHRAAVLKALGEVEDALVALDQDQQRRSLQQRAATAASEAAQLARQRYQGGLIDFQTVLDTQRSQLAAQDSLALAQADVAGDVVRLYKALGGGWVAVGVDDAAPGAAPVSAAVSASTPATPR